MNEQVIFYQTFCAEKYLTNKKLYWKFNRGFWITGLWNSILWSIVLIVTLYFQYEILIGVENTKPSLHSYNIFIASTLVNNVSETNFYTTNIILEATYWIDKT